MPIYYSPPRYFSDSVVSSTDPTMNLIITINKNWLLRHNVTARQATEALSNRTNLNIKVQARAIPYEVGDMIFNGSGDQDVDKRVRIAWQEWQAGL